MNPTQIIDRIRGLIVSPKLEWPKIAAEETTVAQLYQGYVLWLAALPPLFGFVKSSLLGYGAFGETLRIGPVHGITQMVLVYGVGVAVAWVLAKLVEVLASGFGGTSDPRRATQLAAYALTAHWLAGVGLVLPFVSVPVMLAGWAYTGYLVYLGLPHVVRCPTEKSGGYAVTVTFLAFVISIAGFTAARIVAGVNAALSGPSTYVSDRADGDSPLDRAAAFGLELEAATRELRATPNDRAAQKRAERALEHLIPPEPKKPPQN